MAAEKEHYRELMIGANQCVIYRVLSLQSRKPEADVCRVTRVCYVSAQRLIDFENKGVDEDGNYERISQRVGDGVIPIEDGRFLIPSEPEAPKV